MATRTPMKAMRAKCLDCCNGNPVEVRLCTCKDCPLYEYRFGKRPATVARHLENKTHQAIESTLEQ